MLKTTHAYSVNFRVWPMYTSNVKNRQHQSILEHRRIGVGRSPISILYSACNDIQVRLGPAAADNHPRRRPSWRSAMWVVVRRAASGTSKDTATTRCQTRLLWHGIEARVICVWWTAWRHSVGVFQVANDRWDNYRRSALFVQRRAPCWPMCVRVTVAVNAVCAGEQCTCETSVRGTRAWYHIPSSPTHSGHQRCSAVT